MNKGVINLIGKWEIKFTNNVHMYCHSLSAKKGEYRVSISCEDLPTKEKTIGIWLHDLDVSEKHKQELQHVLLQWTNELQLHCRVYHNQDEFSENKKST